MVRGTLGAFGSANVVLTRVAGALKHDDRHCGDGPRTVSGVTVFPKSKNNYVFELQADGRADWALVGLKCQERVVALHVPLGLDVE